MKLSLMIDDYYHDHMGVTPNKMESHYEAWKIKP